jgi:hypothetical protein
MAKPNIELLKRLRTRFLRMRHRKHFKMEVVAERTPCGTAMCIAGHALDLQGYRFKFDEYGNIERTFRPSGRPLKAGLLSTAARELRLDYYSADYNLFNDFSLKTPKQAAARIQELIEQAEAN